MSKTAVVLFNLGGVESLDKVQDFLLNLFGDRDIIRFPFGPIGQFLFSRLIVKLRLKSVTEKYRQMGGRSPILDITHAQAQALQKMLGSDYQVFVINRYSEPRSQSVVPQLESFEKIILLPLYPQYSTTTTLSSLNDFYRFYKGSIQKIKLMEFWYYDESYLNAWVELIQASLKSFENPEAVHILFSAHSLPKKVIRRGDPYQKQLEAQVEMFNKLLNAKNPMYLCYQSKVGPIPWLEPSTQSVLQKISKTANADVLIVPISFVSDHFETSYEIDIEFRELAHQLGIKNFKRVPSLNTNPLFIKALSTLVLKRTN